MNFNKGDLVYVDLRHEGAPPICAASKFIRKLDIDSMDGAFDCFYSIETQHHGIVYIDCNSSDLKLFKDSITEKGVI